LGDHHGAIVMSTRSRHYFSDSDHESTLNSPSNGSLTAKPNSPSILNPIDSGGSGGSGSNGADKNGHGKSRFTFDNEFEESLVKSKRKSHAHNGNSNGNSSISSKNGGIDRPPSPTAYQKNQ
jgi:hypothetical protein